MNSLKMDVCLGMHWVAVAHDSIDNSSSVCRKNFAQPVTLDCQDNAIGQIENLHSFKSVTNFYKCTGCSEFSQIAETVDPKSLKIDLIVLQTRMCTCNCSFCLRIMWNGCEWSFKDHEQQFAELYWQSWNSHVTLCFCSVLSESSLIAKTNSLIANGASVEFSHLLIAKLRSPIANMALGECSSAMNNQSMSYPSCIDFTPCKHCFANQESGERRPECSVWLPWLQLRVDWFSGGHVFMSHRCIKKLFNFMFCVVFCVNNCLGEK